MGWARAGRGGLDLIKKVQLSFSLPVLLRTLFEPWRRIVTPSGRSLDEKFRAMLDNLVSRTVGFFVRIFALLAAAVLLVIAVVIGAIMSIAWPLIPILIVFSVVRAVV